MRRHGPFVLALAVTLTCSVLAYQTKQAEDPPTPFIGKVVEVMDGDTIHVRLGKANHKIRLNGIDAPESAQPFGNQAKKALSEKIANQEVRIEWKQRDKYGRIIGEVYLGDRRIGLELVQDGWAWNYTKYSKDPDLAKAEKEAKEAKKGLWVDDTALAPSNWRHDKGIDPEKSDPTNPTVYLTRTGSKYHVYGCKFLASSSKPIPLKDVLMGYEPCSLCNPPTKLPEVNWGEDTKTPLPEVKIDKSQDDTPTVKPQHDTLTVKPAESSQAAPSWGFIGLIAVGGVGVGIVGVAVAGVVSVALFRRRKK